MMTLLPNRIWKKPMSVSPKPGPPMMPRALVKRRPKERYYSIITQSKQADRSYSSVVRDDSTDVLRISLANMAIYECYLFALGLPSSFPTDQIIVYSHDRERYIPRKVGDYSYSRDRNHLYCYELTLPASTEREEYRQRILNDLNQHFDLDVKVEKLSIVKDSRKVFTMDGESVELIWEEQLMLIMRTKRGLVAELLTNRAKYKKLITSVTV
ncbi:hypothetical protein [Sphingobacterium kitahiroshimense]|uniref:Uncharacterized protein n=1 Tax=Sphingobacterium kitahiroshimense TaxID=470446 RepID=A0ABV0BPB2_9SPHI